MKIIYLSLLIIITMLFAGKALANNVTLSALVLSPVSPNTSTIDSEVKDGVANGDTPVKVTVTIKSKKGEIIPQKTVKMSSSRPFDIVDPSPQITNELGQVTFDLRSTKEGTSQYLVAADDTIDLKPFIFQWKQDIPVQVLGTSNTSNQKIKSSVILGGITFLIIALWLLQKRLREDVAIGNNKIN